MIEINTVGSLTRAARPWSTSAPSSVPSSSVSGSSGFNLADDILEVLRPLADWSVFCLVGQGRRSDDDGLTRDQRQHLA